MSVFSDNAERPKKITFKPKSLSSKFRYKDLEDLDIADKSYLSALSMIGHVDMNAFFAQVEQFKHGFSKDDPILCVQWLSIIAVNYPARKFGITRMDNVKSAVKKCPYIVPLHTAVFKKGENFWRNVNTSNYLDFPSPANHKVSLDPYRRESRKILRIIKQHFRLVEKASVDECFFDVGPEVYQEILKNFPFIKEKIDTNHDENDYLPHLSQEMISVFHDKIFGHFPEKVVNSNTAADKDEDDIEEIMISDWDDVVTLFASILCLNLRKLIESYLGYTTSGGIGRTKTLAKLASGYKKPDNQTIIRNCNIDNFLNKFELTDFWGFGGKIGEQILKSLDFPVHDNVKQFTNLKIRENFTNLELESMLENQELANKTFELVRGNYRQELLLNRAIPSMCSSKRFRGETVTKRDDCVEWLKVFSGDLFQRIKEINEEESRSRYPRLISLNYYPLSTRINRSKQIPFPQVMPSLNSCGSDNVLEKTIFEYSLILLDDILKNETQKYIGTSQSDSFFPLGLMSLTVSKFEYEHNLIDNFFIGNQNGADDINKNKANMKLETPANNKLGKEEKLDKPKSFVYESRKKTLEVKNENTTRTIESLLKTNLQKKSTGKTGLLRFSDNADDNSLKSVKREENLHYKLDDKSSKASSSNDRPRLKVEDVSVDDGEQMDEEKYYCPDCEKFLEFESGLISQGTKLTKKDYKHLVNEHKDFHFAVTYSQQLNGESLTNNILLNSPVDRSHSRKKMKVRGKEKFDVLQQLKMRNKKSRNTENNSNNANETIHLIHDSTDSQSHRKEDCIIVIDDEEEMVINDKMSAFPVQKKREFVQIAAEGSKKDDFKKLKKDG